MSEYQLPNISIFESDDGWQTIFERSYNSGTDSDEENLMSSEEGRLLITHLIDHNDFLLTQSEQKRNDFLYTVVAANKLAANQRADLDIRFHKNEKMMCVRIFSPVFMLLCHDIIWLHHSCFAANYIEIEALDDEENKTRISIGVSFTDNIASMSDFLRKLGTSINNREPSNDLP